MNIYVESNFVLELALVQEQQASCEEIVRLCEAGGVRLVAPAYSFVEPYETLVRRHSRRKDMKGALDNELGQLIRTADYAVRLSGFKSLTGLLIESADAEANRLEQVRARLLKTCEVVSLDASTLAAATQYQIQHGLSPQDAIVYASVLSHLMRSTPPVSCFLNRNSKDFDDPDIDDELKRHRCILIPRFDDGLKYVRSHLTKESGPA